MKYLLNHGHLIIDGSIQYVDGAILVEDEKILEVYPQASKVKIEDEHKVVELDGAIVMPGFFDTHCHGTHLINYDNASPEQMDEASLYNAKSGTTSFLPSISYDLTKDELLNQVKVLDKCFGKYARIQGIHLEGPFLSKKHLGVGDAKKFQTADVEYVKELLNASDRIKQMTIAIEEEGAKDCAKILKENGVRVMVGHSDALMSDLNEDVDGFTHLYNAMRGLHHRDLTLVNAAFTNNYYVELITDGHHVDKSVLKLTYSNIDRDKLIAISDASIAQGLPDGEYTFISNRCIKEGTVFKTEGGKHAGSVVTINDEVKILKEIGFDYNDILLFSSLNGYRLYGLDNLFGTITKGKYSDLVIMDEDLNVKNVLVRGKFINE